MDEGEWVTVKEEWKYLRTDDFWWNFRTGIKMLWGGFRLCLIGSCYFVEITPEKERN